MVAPPQPRPAGVATPTAAVAPAGTVGPQGRGTPLPPAGARWTSRVVPTGVFERAHARWLLLVSVLTMFGFLSLFAVVAALTSGEPGNEELFASLLYVPLLGWVGYLVWRHGVRLGAFFRLPRIGWYWFVVLGMSVASFSFSIGASNITAALFPDYVAGAEVSPSSGVGVLAFSLVVVPPFVEELIFRGVLLERWAVKWRLGVAIVVQGICFGILHVDPVGAGVFGVIMALMYLRCRTLWVPIAMHALNNGVVLLAVLLVPEAANVPEEPQSLGEAVITGGIFMGVALPFIALFVYRNWPSPRTLTPYEVAEHGPDALPPRHVGRIRIVAGPAGTAGQAGRLRLTVSGVLVTRDRRGREVLTAAPYEAIRWIGVAPDHRGLDLRAADGTSLQLLLPQRSARARREIVAALGDRVRDRAGVEPAWAPAIA